uniref:Uncharacterized protein n=1 Tax=Onchocerca volvulus TaxID=6282 RepID=A0A8R1TL33_ONCVO
MLVRTIERKILEKYNQDVENITCQNKSEDKWNREKVRGWCFIWHVFGKTGSETEQAILSILKKT